MNSKIKNHLVFCCKSENKMCCHVCFFFFLERNSINIIISINLLLETEQLPNNNLPLSTKVDSFETPYTFNLDTKFKEIALEELREDDKIREQALTQFREWIAKHPHIKKCRTDTIFLLRFLRTNKFSVPAACKMLEKYLTIRQLYPQWFQKLDIEEKEMEEILDCGYIVPLPERDEYGRQVIMARSNLFDPYRFTSAQMARVHSLVCECLIDDEESQIAGYTYINDETGISLGFISLWSLTDIRNMLRCIQNSTPMRHKENHFISIPHYANKLIEFAMSLISEKLKKRVVIHKDIDQFKERFDKRILPAEYGGTVSIKEIITDFKKRLRKQRDAILALDDMYIEITKDNVNFAGNEDADIDSGMVGSFRKLAVD